ncbi:MAG: hypothetical protein PUE46_01850 [Eubacteriales bacterium]|nr:hypothetical protein [Eubacteriales bacterium]
MYQRQRCEIIVVDSHAFNLYSILIKHNVIEFYPQAVRLDIQIDVLVIVKIKSLVDLVFIETKKTPLNLHDFGQLCAYCILINPVDVYLSYLENTGSLEKDIKYLGREYLLDFRSGKTIKNEGCQMGYSKKYHR